MKSNGHDDGRGKDWVALTLAIGIATAVNAITFAVVYDAIASAGPGLSENATQVLTAAFGGILGVLGAYVGYRAGTTQQAALNDALNTPTAPAAPTFDSNDIEPDEDYPHDSSAAEAATEDANERRL